MTAFVCVLCGYLAVDVVFKALQLGTGRFKTATPASVVIDMLMNGALAAWAAALIVGTWK